MSPYANGNTYTLLEGVTAKHKFATQALEPNDPVTMYGVLVGKAARPIARGEALTTENVKHAAQSFGRRWATYTWYAPEAVGSGFDMNPSPGNIKDGLITDPVKSAGAAKKGGTSPVEAVLDYPAGSEAVPKAVQRGQHDFIPWKRGVSL